MAHAERGFTRKVEPTEAEDHMWSSPSHEEAGTQNPDMKDILHSDGRPQSRIGDVKDKQQEVRERMLRDELASVRKVNEAVEGVIRSLEKAKCSMTTVNHTVDSASALLNTWTRILSQTEHNQRLILNPSWQGASKDLADAEREAYAKQQAAERREHEENERRMAAAKTAEDEEKRRAEAAAKPSKAPPRGKGRPTSRGTSTTTTATSGYVAVGGQVTRGSVRGAATGSRRTTSGIGRGYGAVRGRGGSGG